MGWQRTETATQRWAGRAPVLDKEDCLAGTPYPQAHSRERNSGLPTWGPPNFTRRQSSALYQTLRAYTKMDEQNKRRKGDGWWMCVWVEGRKERKWREERKDGGATHRLIATQGPRTVSDSCLCTCMCELGEVTSPLLYSPCETWSHDTYHPRFSWGFNQIRMGRALCTMSNTQYVLSKCYIFFVFLFYSKKALS